MKIRRIIKWVLVGVASVIGLAVLTFGIYLLYMQSKYYRIEDNTELTVENNQTAQVEKNKQYTVVSYNIGFGAYSQDYSFFMDEGVMEDGTKTQGKYGKGRSKEETLRNTNGSISILQELNPDFIFLQEVDEAGYRSYNINQKQMITDTFSSYSYTYASNYHCGFVALPLSDPMGTAFSGLLSLSRFQMNSSLRRQLPISTSFITKFTDLDRCIDIMRYTLEDKELVLINVHLSAYDKGGVYRKKQIDLINSILTEEKNKGNYVILGGDTNHDIANTVGMFPSKQKLPEWVSVLTSEDIAEGFKIVAGTNWGSCRGADIPYEKGVDYVVTVDGYIISNEIEVNEIYNYDNDFLYSDHLPAVLKFTIK